MAWANQDKCAIVGIGATDYYVRGKSWPRTINDMAAEAIMNACADAGISHKQIDGFSYYSTAGAGYLDKFDTASLMETLGMPHISWSATLTSGGGGCPGAIGLATRGAKSRSSGKGMSHANAGLPFTSARSLSRLSGSGS